MLPGLGLVDPAAVYIGVGGEISVPRWTVGRMLSDCTCMRVARTRGWSELGREMGLSPIPTHSVPNPEAMDVV
jgi:hypothetical protein